jgi:hypothetical protein
MSWHIEHFCNCGVTYGGSPGFQDFELRFRLGKTLLNIPAQEDEEDPEDR